MLIYRTTYAKERRKEEEAKRVLERWGLGPRIYAARLGWDIPRLSLVAGDLLIIDPDREPVEEDLVLVRLGDQLDLREFSDLQRTPSGPYQVEGVVLWTQPRLV